jgi:LytS/YehU family sensor histidine kinase
MDSLFNQICVFVTAAFVLTLVPGLRQECSLLSVRDRGTALLVFLILGLAEDATVSHSGWVNERLVSVCAAGLVAGPWVGLAISVFVTWLAVRFDGLPFVSIGISMLCGGLGGGLLYRWRPKLAQQPLTGFCLTLTVSLLRNGIFLYAHNARAPLHTLKQTGMAAVLQGLSTALIVAIIAHVRDRDEQTRAAVLAEVRALQARMNPHFLFNSLNALAALATVAPREIPRAAGRLRDFLRASFDQHERALVPLEEELAVVRAYLAIESLRFGNRLKIEESIEAEVLAVLTPPFSLQALVENAVQHGLQSSANAGRLRLAIRAAGEWLELSVSDDGKGVASREVEHVFFAQRPDLHALSLLRRRLQTLFGCSFRLEVYSEIGQGTTVTLCIPRQPPFEIVGTSLKSSRRTPADWPRQRFKQLPSRRPLQHDRLQVNRPAAERQAISRTC